MIRSKEKRILLDEEATELIETKVGELRGKSCRLNPSRLSSLIVKIFCNRYFEREAQAIEESFFDERAYLKDLINSSTGPEDISRSVEELLKRVKRSRAKRSDKTKEVNGE